jgi:hypothetical protein
VEVFKKDLQKYKLRCMIEIDITNSNGGADIMEESPPKNKNAPKNKKGGSREGSGRKNLQELGLMPVQTRISLHPDIWAQLDLYTTLRDGEPKKFPERHRVDLLRDILTAVVQMLQNSGLDGDGQAKMTKRLHEVLKLKEDDENG